MSRSANSRAAWTHGGLIGKVLSAQRGMTAIEQAPTASEVARLAATDIILQLAELKTHLDDECVYPEPLKGTSTST
jgi:hypothetical protein